MRRTRRKVAVALLLVAGSALIAVGTTAVDRSDLPASPTPQPQESLAQLFRIDWKKMPSLPRGFQGSNGGIVDGTLVTTCGFCSGERGVKGKPHTYPRGHMKNTWGLNLEQPADGWRELPDFPGEARQDNFAVVVNDELYTWGGFSYSEPYCYDDGYKLSHSSGRWVWERLPDLPWRVCTSGVCANGSNVYVVGGADYDREKFYTTGDRVGKTSRLGTRLLVIDTKNLGAGWRELAPCPGTPRWAHATAAVDGKIYVLGGATGNDNVTGQYCTVVDNWRYDPGTDEWDRLRDLPVASGNFPAGQILYNDRYMVLVGGYQYAWVLNPDGTTRKPYGKPFAHYKGKSYYSDVFVYDTMADMFGTATPLPLNNNVPMTVVLGDQIHLIGGETGGAVVQGEHFGHHPDLYLVGDIIELRTAKETDQQPVGEGLVPSPGRPPATADLRQGPPLQEQW